MPKSSNGTIPRYRKHKASGQAVTTLSGADHYLGPYGSAASKREYDRVVAEWIARGRTPEVATEELTVNEILVAYLKHAQTYYTKNGRPTSEVACTKATMAPLKRLYGRTLASEFGPLKLKAVRQQYIDAGHCRTAVNRHILRLRQIFKWAVAEEMIPPSVCHGLATVAGLRRGRSDARESEPVKPVDDALVDAIRPHVTTTVWAMVELMRLTGMRVGEATIMRGRDLDTRGAVWLYRPAVHKAEHHGRERVVDLGPRAKAILKPFLKPDVDGYLFSPEASEQERHTSMRARRKTPVQPSQRNRRKRKPQRKPGEAYSTESLRRAITRACDAAFPPPDRLARLKGETESAWRARLTEAQREELRQWRHNHRWHPHRLRHSFATRVRREHGIEVARILCGHASIVVTEVYAEADRLKATAVVAKIG